MWLSDREVGIIGGWVGNIRRKKRYEGKMVMVVMKEGWLVNIFERTKLINILTFHQSSILVCLGSTHIRC